MPGTNPAVISDSLRPFLSVGLWEWSLEHHNENVQTSLPRGWTEFNSDSGQRHTLDISWQQAP